jgi:hypothetical protein
MLEMTHLINKRFLWRTSATGLLVFDYFLFSTGNPSVTYRFLGGWFGVMLLAAFVVTASYGYESFTRGENKRFFVLHILLLTVFSLALFVASPYARQLASARLQAKADSFIKDPISYKADLSSEERQLMVGIEKQKFTMQRSAFIPTFQRTDYLLRTEQGATYLLVMETQWNGTPVISLHPTQANPDR